MRENGMWGNPDTGLTMLGHGYVGFEIEGCGTRCEGAFCIVGYNLSLVSTEMVPGDEVTNSRGWVVAVKQVVWVEFKILILPNSE